MQYEEMITGLERRQDLDRQQAGTLLAATVQALRETAEDEALDLQAQLPAELAEVTPSGHAPQRSLEEYFVRIGDLCGLDDLQLARGHAQGGFSMLAEAVSAGQLRQLMQSLPSEYAALAPKTSGLTGDEETLLADLRRQAKLDDLEQARTLAQAVLSTLGEATSGGQAEDVAAALPEDLGAHLRSEHSAGHTESDRFFDEVVRRSTVTNRETVHAHVTAVFDVLRQWAPTETTNLLGQLPRAVAGPGE